MSEITLPTIPPQPSLTPPEDPAKLGNWQTLWANYRWAVQMHSDAAMREVQRQKVAALTANEIASRELITLAAGFPSAQPGAPRRDLALRILLAQPQVTGQTELQAVDCAIRLADAFSKRIEAS
jgi:hypothetical protein